MDPLTLDPQKNSDPITATLLFMLYEGLTRLQPDGTVDLSLAESVQISPDSCTYTFRLKKALWTDGEPITAHDFERSWKRALSPSFPSNLTHLFYPIRNFEAASRGLAQVHDVGLRALGERTFQVELSRPTPYFLSLISFCNFFPIPSHIDKANPAWDCYPLPSLVTSGPFQLAKWERGKEIVVHKNALYWDADNTNLLSVHISIVNDKKKTMEMFQNGQLDWIYSALSPLSSPNLSGEKITNLFGSANVAICAFNTQQYPFHNQNIRKAFSLALDRRLLANNAGGALPAHRLISPSIEKKKVRLIPPFNPKLARSYLKKGMEELGIGGGAHDLKMRIFLNSLTLSYASDEELPNGKVAEAIQSQWASSLGFRVQLKPQPFQTQMDKISRGDFSICLRSLSSTYNDPMNLFERFKDKHSERNFPRFESGEYIDLLNQSSEELDPTLREKILLKAEAHLLDQMPISPLYHKNHSVLARSEEAGVAISPIGCAHFQRAQNISHSAVS
jgi:oligopeptide transport system substrate-binding protein